MKSCYLSFPYAGVYCFKEIRLILLAFRHFYYFLPYELPSLVAHDGLVGWVHVLERKMNDWQVFPQKNITYTSVTFCKQQ